MDRDQKMTWRKTPMGDWVATKGMKVYRVRRITFPKPMWWVYHGILTPGGYKCIGRFSAGGYEDCVSFGTLSAAKKFVENLG